MNRSGEIKEQVKETYGEIARTRVAGDGGCCVPRGTPADYSADEIASVPQGAYLGEGSGNPVRAAKLQSGETVVDLGSGAGMDVFLSANAVGRSGRVIGVDMTPGMLERAKASAGKGSYPQVEFRQGDIEKLPIPSGTADVVISNCVINLAPDKKTVFREIYRVLRPGGCFAISDIVLRSERPRRGGLQKVLKKIPAASCIASAWQEQHYLGALREAGFQDVRVVAERRAIDQPALDFITAHGITVVGTKPGQ